MHSRAIALIVIFFLLAGAVVARQSAPAATPKPISQQGLTEALRIGGLTTQEMIDIVKERGVAFPVTAAVESDLRAAGAPSSLIEVIRANYRPPAREAVAVLDPLSKNEIATLLQVGTPSVRIQQIVAQRGVSFPLTPAITSELNQAGADSALLAAIETAWSKSPAAAPAPQPELPAARPSPQEVKASAATPAKTEPPPLSMAQVRKLYVEKMKSNLDQYLRAELTKQLPGRFLLVLNKDEADALLVGAGEQKSGAGAAITGRYLGLHDTASGAVSMVDKTGTVLWASEAGDRTLLLGPFKRGGAREVASRLIQDLKKTLESAE